MQLKGYKVQFFIPTEELIDIGTEYAAKDLQKIIASLKRSAHYKVSTDIIDKGVEFTIERIEETEEAKTKV